MEILVLGKGFLGQAFEKAGFEVWDRTKFEWSGSKFNNNPTLMEREFNKILEKNPTAVVNCIGESNTRKCEDIDNFYNSIQLNGFFPILLSNFLQRNNIKFVHISTGCLYDVSNVPQNEQDFLAAHCNYTIGKWISDKGCNPVRDLILRPRLYFGRTNNKNNLLCKLPRFEKYNRTLDSLTSVEVIVEATKQLLYKQASGIFNVACEGVTSIYEIAKAIQLPNVQPMDREELLKNQKLHLVNCIMDISKLKQFYQPPQIMDEVLSCYKQLNEENNI